MPYIILHSTCMYTKPYLQSTYSAAVDSWPGVCHTFLTFVISELGKARPDASIQRIAKKFFQQSEAARRTSRPGMLLNRASRTFIAFQRIMSTATLKSPLGQEFGNILRVHLLTVPQYTATATALSFQGETNGSLPNLKVQKLKCMQKAARQP